MERSGRTSTSYFVVVVLVVVVVVGCAYKDVKSSSSRRSQRNDSETTKVTGNAIMFARALVFVPRLVLCLCTLTKSKCVSGRVLALS